MADLFPTAPAQAGAPRKAPSLHSDTEIYFAVDRLGAYVMRAVSSMQKGMKGILGEALLFETTEMSELVRLANIARDAAKIPYLDEILGRLERVRFILRNANTSEFLPHKTYAASIDLTESISKQAYGLKKRYAPAPSPVT